MIYIYLCILINYIIYIYILIKYDIVKQTEDIKYNNEDVVRNQNTRDHLTRNAGNGDPIHAVCILHRIPRAWEQLGAGQK